MEKKNKSYNNPINENTLRLIGWEKQYAYIRAPSIILYDEGLDVAAKAIYYILLQRSQFDTDTFVSIPRIGRDLGISTATVKRRINLLKKYKLLIVEHRKDPDTDAVLSNIYRLIHPSVIYGEDLVKKAFPTAKEIREVVCKDRNIDSDPGSHRPPVHTDPGPPVHTDPGPGSHRPPKKKEDEEKRNFEKEEIYTHTDELHSIYKEELPKEENFQKEEKDTQLETSTQKKTSTQPRLSHEDEIFDEKDQNQNEILNKDEISNRDENKDEISNENEKSNQNSQTSAKTQSHSQDRQNDRCSNLREENKTSNRKTGERHDLAQSHPITSAHNPPSPESSQKLSALAKWGMPPPEHDPSPLNFLRQDGAAKKRADDQVRSNNKYLSHMGKPKLKPGQTLEDWEQSRCSKVFHQCFVDSMKEQGMHAPRATPGYLKRWKDQFFPKVGSAEKGLIFIDWAVKNWSLILKRSDKLTTPNPTVDLLVSSWMDQFITELFSKKKTTTTKSSSSSSKILW